MKVQGLVSATLEVVNTVKEVFESGRTYFCKKLSSTTAEMSRSGFPIPNKIPSDAIFLLFAGEMNRDSEMQQLMRVERSGVLRGERRMGVRGFIVTGVVAEVHCVI